MSLHVERCDPRDRTDGIVDLFRRHGQERFAEVFERVYRARAADGLRSWLGVEDGRVAMHISVSEVPMANGFAELLGGVLGDLMVEESKRNFWAPVQLLRTLVSDLDREGRVQFLLTTTVADAASVFHATGFRPIGNMRRFVLPLREPYISLSRLRARAQGFPVDVRQLGDEELNRLLPDLHAGSLWRPSGCSSYYATRIPRQEYRDGTWVGVGANGGPRGWALLSNHGDWPEIGLADAFWRDEPAGLINLLHGAARWARARRYPKMTVSALDGGSVGRALRRAGFFPRSVRTAVLARPVAGTVPPAEEWFLNALLTSVW